MRQGNRIIVLMITAKYYLIDEILPKEYITSKK